MCLFPTLRPNKKYVANKKNGGNVPVCIDERTKWVPTKCGNCMECRKAIAREWQIRLLEEIRNDNTGKMVTLTFSTESLKKLAKDKYVAGSTGYEKDNAIAKRALRLFNERWRKKNKVAIKHWVITELGGGTWEHMHMHGILWTTESREEIQAKWDYGKVHFGDWVNEQTVTYCTKYVYKKDPEHPNYKSRVLTSPGMGKGYTKRIDARNNKYKVGETKEYYKTRTGHKVALPVYWRNKLYTEEERERLWIEKLDKQERWVDGRLIDISKGDENYWKALKEARKKNKRLGYKDDSKDWDKIKYENQLRQLKINERLKGEANPQERLTSLRAGEKHLAVMRGGEGAEDSTTSGMAMPRSKEWE